MDDYTTSCLLDYVYFKDNYRLTLDADPRATQQIVFQFQVVGVGNGTKIRIYISLEQSKETVLEFYKGTGKVL